MGGKVILMDAKRGASIRLRAARVALRERPGTDPLVLDAIEALEVLGDESDQRLAEAARLQVAAVLAEVVNRDYRRARRRYRWTVAAAVATALICAALIANVPAAIVAAQMNAQQEIEQ